MRRETLFVLYEANRHQLPVLVAVRVVEIADYLGLTPGSIRTMMSRKQLLKGRYLVEKVKA